MRLSVIKCVCEKSPVVSYHRQQINPTSDFANGSKTRTCKRCCIGRHSQNARLERRNASFSDEKIRTATVPGQTLERGKGRNQVAASIKERNCDRQINKIGRDKMMAYLSSFYGTDRKANSLSPLPTPHSPLPLCLLALPEQTAYSRIERRARLGVVHRVFENGLQVIDRVADGQPFAVGHGLGDDATPATYVFAHRVGQPQLVRFAQRNLAQDLDHGCREQKAPEHRQV